MVQVQMRVEFEAASVVHFDLGEFAYFPIRSLLSHG